MFQAHEGEIMNIIPVDSSTFVTTSLDQVVSVWSVQEARAKCSMSSAQEPIHCAALFDNNFVVATTSNRIMIRHGLTSEAGQFHSNKLKADVLKGNLSSLAALSMNRLLLLGQDSGNITLLC
jgi:WD repeat-containing protein 81